MASPATNDAHAPEEEDFEALADSETDIDVRCLQDQKKTQIDTVLGRSKLYPSQPRARHGQRGCGHC